MKNTKGSKQSVGRVDEDNTILGESGKESPVRKKVIKKQNTTNELKKLGRYKERILEKIAALQVDLDKINADMKILEKQAIYNHVDEMLANKVSIKEIMTKLGDQQ